MPKKQSGGILLFRTAGETGLEVLLVHPGGPFWARKDAGAWSIPKGEYEDGEDARAAAIREFAEETGMSISDGSLIELGRIRQKNGKVVDAWALEGAFESSSLISNVFTMEWPRGSGNVREFPEVDRAEWFDLATARTKILVGQDQFLDRLAALLAEQGTVAG